MRTILDKKRTFDSSSLRKLALKLALYSVVYITLSYFLQSSTRHANLGFNVSYQVMPLFSWA
jgi:hypothetical protein